MKNRTSILLLLGLVTGIISCSDEPQTPFTILDRSDTGIDFRNLIRETEKFNIFNYQYFHNGAGVAVGDFNNDGLQDICFTGNMVKNRLYLNQGGLQFKDITVKSTIAEKEGWCTGVTTVDINQDGWLDLYICRAGYPFTELRKNLLFVNNGDLTFSEKAAEYGLDDEAHSTQASFFDYDRDGDLDLFLINHSTPEYSKGNLQIFQLKEKKNPAYTNKLYRNDDNFYTDVTHEAGITSNVLTFSLGLSIADINLDGWPDVFVGNDFNEPDHLFINNGDGTFNDRLSDKLDYTSLYSMGSDIADINNDGFPDLITLDMLPEDNYSQKMHSGADNYDKVKLMEKGGFYRQYSRNMLQMNNGDGTFSETGQIAGVSNTDWSWSALFLDFDNDGNKDLFVSNGYLRDHTNMDFLRFTANEVLKSAEDQVGFEEYIGQMPRIDISNRLFLNSGTGLFSDQTRSWGLDKTFISQGAAYADLDNDGDTDIVVNNTEDRALIYRNNTTSLTDHNFLKVKLNGSAPNLNGIGAKVYVFCDGKVRYQEQMPVRGFQSSVSHILHFGLGKNTRTDSVLIIWPTGEKQIAYNVKGNQTLEIALTANHYEKISAPPEAGTVDPLFSEVKTLTAYHQENDHNDFKLQNLLPYFQSRSGPAMATGDVNGDGLPDLYFGGARGQSSLLFIQQSDHSFRPVSSYFQADSMYEDTDVLFLDIDGDKDLDLYVASGGFGVADTLLLEDRLYINDGKGRFRRETDLLPALNKNTTVIAAADMDGDGDIDLFTGGGYVHGKYPLTHSSHLLVNQGKGRYTLAPEQYQQGLAGCKKITGAGWQDLNGDHSKELILVGEWMPLTILENTEGFTNKTRQYVNAPLEGLWQSLLIDDMDADGDADLILGNLGENTQIRVGENRPMTLHFDDFDRNGSIDPLICYYQDSLSYPMASLEDLLAQLPSLQKKFQYFESYAHATIEDLLSEQQLTKARVNKVTTLKTVFLRNEGGRFHSQPLPWQVHTAPVFAMASHDLNGDGLKDLVLAGNLSEARIKLGRLFANHGITLLGNPGGGFDYLPQYKSGLELREDIRDIAILEGGKSTPLIVFGR